MNFAVEVRDLHYRYPDGKQALQGVGFQVSPGECVGVIGPNGAGKSTLLLHLNGLLPEEWKGPPAVTVMGLPVDEKHLQSVHRRVGFLFQDPDDQLFCATVFEDVAFGPRQFNGSDEQLRSIVGDALARVGLQGYEGRAPHHLSLGEKQRVCLAGVLACQPDILVLDEPTSNLDPRGKRELKDLLRSLGKTLILASHDLELVVDLCRRTLLLDGGRIMADGPTVGLLSDEALMLAHGLEKPHILAHRHPH